MKKAGLFLSGAGAAWWAGDEEDREKQIYEGKSKLFDTTAGWAKADNYVVRNSNIERDDGGYVADLDVYRRLPGVGQREQMASFSAAEEDREYFFDDVYDNPMKLEVEQVAKNYVVVELEHE